MKKRRFLVIFNLFFVFGVAAGYLKTLSPLFLLPCVAALSVFFYIAIKKNTDISSATLLCLMFLTGFFVFSIHNNAFENKYSSLPYNKIVYISGTIYGNPIEGEGWLLYKLKDCRVYSTQKKLLVNAVNLNMFMQSSVNSDKTESNLKHGTTITILTKLKRPLAKTNPGERDWLIYAKTDDIFGSFSANLDNIKIAKNNDVRFLSAWIMRCRAKAGDLIEANYSPIQSEILRSMVVGDQNVTNEKVYSDLRDSGVLHIISISGLHVSFVIMLLMVLGQLLKFQGKIFISSILSGVIIYVIFSGAEAPVIRSALMAVCAMMGDYLGREGDGLTSLSLAAFILIIFNPFLLFTIGFQLSFLGTIGMLLFRKPLEGYLGFLPKWISDPLALSIGATLATAPLVAYVFGQFTPIAIVANIPIVPISGLVTCLGLISILLGAVLPILVEMIAVLNSYLINLLLYLAENFANIPLAYFNLNVFSLWHLIACYALISFWLIYYSRKQEGFKGVGIEGKSAFSVFIIFFLAIILIPLTWQGTMRVVFMDTGQGDSIYIRTPNGKNILVDAGGNKRSDIGEMVIVPVLRSQWVDSIDMLVLTHPHEDHAGGVSALSGKYKINSVVAGAGNKMDYIKLTGNVMSKCWITPTAGKTIDLGEGCRMEILAPAEKTVNTVNDTNPNEYSLVVRLVYDESSFLLTGDIEEESIAKILASGCDIDCDVIKLPHHGSHTVKTDDLLCAVNAGTAVITVGEGNRYGHPFPETLQVVRNLQMSCLRTDENGAVIFDTDGKKIKLVKY